MIRSAAEILREYGPFPGVDQVHGVTFDGQHVWFASGDKLNAFAPASGKIVRSIDAAGDAGTAFDGQHLYQLAEDRIQKIDPNTGRVLATIPAPSGGCSGLAWAEGTLWVGQYRDRKIHQIDPETGAILRTIETNRFVTGVAWIEGELWHGTWEGDESELRRVDPRTGEVLESVEMPPGTSVSGLESDGGDQFFCGGGISGKVRAVRRPRRGSAAMRAARPGTTRGDPMSKITPTLWYDGTAEEAANFYVSLLPDSRIEEVNRSPIDTPSGPAGMVLTVVFTLAGQRFCGLNGGPQFPHSEAVSFMIETEDQAETDRLWDAIASNGGQPSACGWIKDRWGVSWQITPKRLLELYTDQDRGRAQRAMQAMMQMSKIDIAALERAAAAKPA